MLTRAQAIEAVKNLDAAVIAWETGDTPTTDWRGKPMIRFTQALAEKMGECCAVFLTTEIEKAAWHIALAMDRFRDEVNVFFKAHEEMEDVTRPDGTREMWEAWATVKNALTQPPRKLPGGIRELQRTGATPITIAKKYGWYLSNGKPDLQKVSEEDTAPGTHYNPETFIHPTERSEMARLQSQWDARCQKLQHILQRETTAPSRQPRKPDPQPLETLISNNPGITLKQIAIRKCCSEDEIREQLEEQGLMLSQGGLRVTDPSKRAAWLNRGATDDDQEARAVTSEWNVHDECGTDLEARILAMSEDGVKPRNIAKALSHRFPTGVTHQQVTTTLKRLQTADAT